MITPLPERQCAGRAEDRHPAPIQPAEEPSAPERSALDLSHAFQGLAHVCVVAVHPEKQRDHGLFHAREAYDGLLNAVDLGFQTREVATIVRVCQRRLLRIKKVGALDCRAST